MSHLLWGKGREPIPVSQAHPVTGGDVPTGRAAFEISDQVRGSQIGVLLTMRNGQQVVIRIPATTAEQIAESHRKVVALVPDAATETEVIERK
jgi:hypothetical protein